MKNPAGFKLSYRAFFAALCGAGLVGSSAAADDTRMRAAKEHALPSGDVALAAQSSPEINAGLAGSFLSGRFARQNQDLKEAAHYLAATLTHDQNNKQLQQELMRMHLLAGDVQAATALAHRLIEEKNTDPLVAGLLMLERVRQNDFAAAQSIISQTSSAGLFGLIRPVMLEWLTMASGQHKGAVDMRTTIDKAGFFAPFIYYHTALMNDMLDNKTEAETAYGKASADAAVTPYRVVEAITNFNARQGNWEQAQAVYDAYKAANPQSSLIPDKVVRGAAPTPLVADAKQGLAELFFTTASILFSEDTSQDTFLYLRMALELRPDLHPAQLMMANLYEQIGDYKQAIATYDAIPEGSIFSRRAQVRKALNYEALGQKEKALELLKSMASRYQDDATALIARGDIERESGNYRSAAESYGAAIGRTEPMEASDWPLLYARGISYERAGEWNKAEADFMRALTLQPEQPEVLNYLAYSWLTMNKNIAQARAYLETASAQRPDDGHIIDSVGWAHYLSGNFADAVTQFERAVEKMPDDVTVNEHLGDAYWRVGREVEARYQWERALNFKPEKDRADLLKDKIASGMNPFVAITAEAQAQASARPLPTETVQTLSAPAGTRVQ